MNVTDDRQMTDHSTEKWVATGEIAILPDNNKDQSNLTKSGIAVPHLYSHTNYGLAADPQISPYPGGQRLPSRPT